MDKKKRRRGNNEGSISQYADGRWCGRYFVELPDGRKKRKALYGNSRKEVTNKLARALAKRDDGALFDDEGQSLGEYIEWWLTTSKRGRVRATTYESYAREVRKHIIPGLGRMRLRRGWHRSFDGKDRDRPGQRHGGELHRHLVKTELVHRQRFPERGAARSANFFEYLEGFYNRLRLHSALSYRSPADYEEATMEGAAVA
jgi:transposase InsO family protein